MKDLTPEEAGRWMSAAPVQVQEAVVSPATEQFIEQLGKQFSLSAEVVELLMKLTSYMLLGYAGPEESSRELQSAGVPDQRARQIITEIVKKICIPLREWIGNVVQTPPESLEIPAEPVVVPPPPIKPSAPPFRQEYHDYTIPIPANPMMPRPAVAPSEGGLRPSSVVPARPPVTEASKPPADEKLLEDHEEPHIDIRDKVQGVSAAPARTAPRPAVAFGIGGPPPLNLPGAMPEVRPSLRPTVASSGGGPEISKVEPQIQKPVPPLPARPYSTDPYREPME